MDKTAKLWRVVTERESGFEGAKRWLWCWLQQSKLLVWQKHSLHRSGVSSKTQWRSNAFRLCRLSEQSQPLCWTVSRALWPFSPQNASSRKEVCQGCSRIAWASQQRTPWLNWNCLWFLGTLRSLKLMLAESSLRSRIASIAALWKLSALQRQFLWLASICRRLAP